MNAFNPRGLAFAAKTATAGITAMLLAMWFNLPNVAWSLLTVFLTSQQLGGATGAVVGRSVHRALGTLLGVAATLFIIPACHAEPALLLPAIAAWVGVCLYLSLLDRSPRSYVFMLGGYTLALIGMPVANSPGSAFDLVLWRAEEIGLGAAVSIAVHTVFAPRSVKPLLVDKLRATVDDARRWMLKGLGPDAVDDAERRARERLAADLAELNTLAVHLRFEPGVTARDTDAVAALEQRLLALLPLLAGVEERLPALRAADADLGERVAAQVEAVRLQLAQPFTQADVTLLAASGQALVDTAQAAFSEGQLLALGAIERLTELMQAWEDSLALLRHLEDDDDVADERTRALLAQASPRPLHFDHALAATSGFAAALAVLVAGALCWGIGWDQGSAAIGIAAAGSSLFAFLDDPRPVHKMLLLVAVLFAIPVAALYVFAIFPALDGPLALSAVVAPLLFFISLYLATPKLGPVALGFAIIWITLTALQPVQTADFFSFTATAIGFLMGTTIALVVTSLVRVIGVQTRVRGLLRAAWRDLAAMADGSGGLARAAWASRMMDRIGLLLPRMSGTDGVLRQRAGRALDDLRIGVNMLDLRQAGLAAQPEVRSAIESVLAQIAAHFRQRLERPDTAPAPAMLVSIDRAIAGLVASDASALRVQGLTAATGLRLGLFPPGAAAAAAAAAIATATAEGVAP
jgi:uncharacterized membrane protein YccC